MIFIATINTGVSLGCNIYNRMDKIPPQEQAAILEAELEIIHSEEVELKDCKANLESHQHKSAQEKASLHEINVLIGQTHAQFVAIQKELTTLRSSLETNIKEKALESREQADQMGDMIAKLRL